MENSDQKIFNKNTISDTVLIAYVTGISYLATFWYQYNFLNYFGIPSDFIQIELPQILLTMLLVIIIGGFFVIVAYNSVYQIKSKEKTKKIDKLISFIFLFVIIFCLFMLTSYAFLHSVKKSLIIAPIFSFIYVLIIRFIILKNKETIEIKKDSIISDLKRKIGDNMFLYLFIGFTAVLIGGSAGQSAATTKSEYLVVNSVPETILVENYEDGFLTIGFSENKRTFNENIYFTSRGEFDLKNLFFTRKSIGPIRNGSDYISQDFITDYFHRRFGFPHTK